MLQRVGIRYVGGPTALLQVGGLQLLTDPTFDPPGEHPGGDRVLVKTAGPAVPRTGWGPSTRCCSPTASTRTTSTPWDALGWPGSSSHADGRALQITGVPAQHGPDGSGHLVGEVPGFVLGGEDLPTVYVSGDNASLEVVRAIADGAGPVDVAVLFALLLWLDRRGRRTQGG